MKTLIINSFLISTVNVIKTMAQTEAIPQTPTLKTHGRTFGDVTGIIDMDSDLLAGTMVLSFSESCILHILSKMFNEPIKEKIDDVVIDAVGELTNMICGGAKAELSKINHTFNMATPVMKIGKDLEITYLHPDQTIVIPFKTGRGAFVVEASLGPCK